MLPPKNEPENSLSSPSSQRSSPILQPSSRTLFHSSSDSAARTSAAGENAMVAKLPSFTRANAEANVEINIEAIKSGQTSIEVPDIVENSKQNAGTISPTHSAPAVVEPITESVNVPFKNFLQIAIFIAAATFVALCAIPSQYTDSGRPRTLLRTNQITWNIFFLSDSAAFLISCGVIILHLCLMRQKTETKTKMPPGVNTSLLLACAFMVIVFCALSFDLFGIIPIADIVGFAVLALAIWIIYSRMKGKKD